MSDDKKKPGWAFCATVLAVCLPFLYVASFGPVCWIYSRTKSLEIWETGYSDRLYYPILWTSWHAPEPVGDAIDWYMNVGAAVNLCVGKDFYTDGYLSVVVPRLDD